MNPQTYDIKLFETADEAEDRGYTVPLTQKQATHLDGMNRKQRRAWLAQQRRDGKHRGK